MPLGKFIVLLGILGIVAWTIHSHQNDIVAGLGWAEERAAAEIDPFIRAEGYFHTFKYIEAAELYQTAIKGGLEEPKRREAFFRTAIALEKAKKKHEALDAYREAMKQYPDTVDANHARSAVERLSIELGR